MQRWMKENDSFIERYETMKKSVLNDPDIQKILKENPSLDQKAIDRQLIKLHEYHSQSKTCENCPTSGCKDNILPGYKPKLEVTGKTIHLNYEKCEYMLKREQVTRKEGVLKSLYMPKDVLDARIESIDSSVENRTEAVKAMIAFVTDLDKELPKKGLYFHGPFGVGKTYFLGAIANVLKEREIETLLIYMPEMVRDIKASFKDDSVNEKIEAYKKVTVLMIDDIGAEALSSWVRDEVLGSILQYRMTEQLPTFFTSNFNLNQLEEHLSQTTNGNEEKLKAGRIIERLREVSKPVEINSRNLRRK